MFQVFDPVFQVSDAAGLAIPNAELFSYEANTANERSLYLDEAGTIPASNPVVADGAGRFAPLYTDGTPYALTLRTPSVGQTLGSIVWSVDYYAAPDLAGAIRFDLAQNLAEPQKLQARENIEALGDRLARTQVNLTNLASSPAGTIALIDGILYKSQPSAINTASVANDLGVDGIAPHGKLYANHFGADVSLVDNGPAIQRAHEWARSNGLREIGFLPGEYEISTQIFLSENPSSFIGEVNAPWQQGSTLPPVTWTWTGGSSSMVACEISNIQFMGIAVQNKGTATDFLELNAGSIRYWFNRMSFVNGIGTTPFSRSIVRSNGNRLGYSRFDSVYCIGSAPKFLDIDGQGTSNSITPVYFGNRCIFESSASQAMTVVSISDESIESLIFECCTFNQQGQQLIVVDTSQSPLSKTIHSLNFINNEWDYSVANASTDRMMKLTNVETARIVGNNLQMGGTPQSLIDLINSNISEFSGNTGRAIQSSIINADADSTINIGSNFFDISNVSRVVNDSAEGHLINVDWTAGNVFLFGHLAANSTHQTHVIEPASSAGWTLTFRHGSQGYFVPGQIITVQLKNTSGGVISAGTPVSAIKTAGPLVAPADGFSRFYTFVFTGSGLMEISRSATDVANG